MFKNWFRRLFRKEPDRIELTVERLQMLHKHSPETALDYIDERNNGK